uniref:NADH dehydrogenase subunit 6 n=1 Tax=Parachordodes pustulosus TaxID=3049253 RepID=UPI002E780F67|nr:NADH dehydrogenase subunit 6 [Parachordodes pustulosus]WQH58898.1 NADH dehydrogenase subunit 6 [Parachordodes pustulosus]
MILLKATNQSHPLTMGVWLVCLSIFMSIYLMQTNHTPIVSIMILMVYTGGLLILFLYTCALSPSPMWNMNNKNSNSKYMSSSMLKWVMSLIWVFFFSYIYMSSSMLQGVAQNMWEEEYSNEWYHSFEYSSSHMFWVTILIVYVSYWGWGQCTLSPSPMWNMKLFNNNYDKKNFSSKVFLL